MEKEKLDISVVNRFRERVNQYDLISHIYKNFDGKNKWNVICSALDWIETCAEGVDITLLSRENNSQASIKLITFISCSDVVWEGIKQLHRVLMNTNSIPFKGDNSVFEKEIDDNDYWKEIRAAFAAHQVNLKGNEGEKKFASWSGGGFGTGDFSVILYSNIIDDDRYEFFDIRFSELLEFIDKRYMYLNDLMKKIEEVTNDYCQVWRKKSIAYQETNIQSTLEMLEYENATRMDIDYFKWRLGEIKQAYTTNSENKNNQLLLEEYRDALLSEVREMYDVLQNMDFDHEISGLNEQPEFGYTYHNQQIFEPQKGLVSWAIEGLKKPLGKYIDFDAIYTISELQVLVRAGWWKNNSEKM